MLELPITLTNEHIHPSLTWTVSLARMQPRRTAFVVLCIFIAGVSGCIMLGPLAGVVAFLILGSALSDYLVPIRFTINSEFAEAKSLTGTKRILWPEVVSCAYSDSALLLSTVKYSSPLFSFRGITLHFGSHREQILELVKVFRSMP